MSMLDCGGTPVDLTVPQTMGILNVTPDSFSDGGQFIGHDEAIAQARRMTEEGAAIIDVGGESTRPGSEPVSVEEELSRVIPVIETIVNELRVPVSVDTSKPEVMEAAVSAGAGMINDVRALRTPGALEAAKNAKVPICLMHMQGEPRTMQDNPRYDDVITEVRSFLSERIDACTTQGIARQHLLIDPGFGFGKTFEHNMQLLHNLDAFNSLNVPLLVGMSRKGMIGKVIDRARPDQRIYGGIAATAIATWLGARIIRVHDVGPTVDALKFCDSVIKMGRV